MSLDDVIASVAGLDRAAMQEAALHLDRLTKPPGSLGRVEDVAVQLAGIARRSPPPVPTPVVVGVFAGDHGVVEEGVTPWPQEVTAQMVANFCAGGAAINVLARHVGAEVVVVDVGVAAPLADAPALRARKVALGTRNLARQPAMTLEQCRAALDVGVAVALDAIAAGAGCLVTGDMGIGNTTPSAALIAAFTGKPAAAVTGRGTGIDDATLAIKIGTVERAVERAMSSAERSPLSILADVGGLEIAALAGFIIAGVARRVPVVVDGVIALAALLAADALAPGSAACCIAGHRSVEPGASVALEYLGLRPVLDLDLRLGEGTGACLAVPVVQAAARIMAEMATFDAAGVTEK